LRVKFFYVLKGLQAGSAPSKDKENALNSLKINTKQNIAPISEFKTDL